MPNLTVENTTNTSFYCSHVKFAAADERPLDRLDLEESGADGEGEAEDGMD